MVLTADQKAGEAAGLFEEGEKLTTDHRKIMNNLVDAVNAQIVCFHPCLISGRCY
jgi:hypothetical protein